MPLTRAELDSFVTRGEIVSELDPFDLRLLKLITAGAARDEIASCLGVSRRTVNRHIARLRRRFSASSTEELATMLAASGFGVPAGTAAVTGKDDKSDE